MNPKGHENALPIRLIYIDTKEEQTFKSIAYASRVTRINEYTIKDSLNPIKKKRFEYNNRIVVFRTIKP